MVKLNWMLLYGPLCPSCMCIYKTLVWSFWTVSEYIQTIYWCELPVSVAIEWPGGRGWSSLFHLAICCYHVVHFYSLHQTNTSLCFPQACLPAQGSELELSPFTPTNRATNHNCLYQSYLHIPKWKQNELYHSCALSFERNCVLQILLALIVKM